MGLGMDEGWRESTLRQGRMMYVKKEHAKFQEF